MSTPDVNPGLYVRPLFYDALSGEFTPPTDPQARAHTLGRLAMAAYTKGELAERSAFTPIDVYSYVPSWAPQVKAELDCDTDDETGLTLMRGLYLSHASGESISVQDDTDPKGVQSVHISGYGHDSYMELALGEQLNTARAAVASLAQTYFTAISRLS